MKRSLFGLGVALIALMMVAGNAMANSPIARNDSSRVTVAQNYVGDFLMGQLYTTEYNYTTKIKIINTSDQFAVVGHLVFRSAICSLEALDFMVFLTPTDAFEATITFNPDTGVAHIVSHDDSVLASSNFVWDDNAPCVPVDFDWANETPEGFSQDFYMDNINAFCPGDTTAMGHFEFYGEQAWRASAPLSKDVLALVSNVFPNLPPITPATVNACNASLNANAAVDVPNVIAGLISINDSYYGQSTSLNMVALKNYSNDILAIGANNAPDLNMTAFNSVAEIEAVLSKNSFVVPFDFAGDASDIRTVVHTTLPTHYLRIDNTKVVPFESDYTVINTLALPAAYFTPDKYGWLFDLKSTGINALAESTDVTAYLDFTTNNDFQIDHNGIGGLTYQVYDMEEKVIIDYLSGDLFSATLDEVTMRSLDEHMLPELQALGYDKGWMRVNFPAVRGFGYATADNNNDGQLDYYVGYTGTPSINTFMTFDHNGDMSWNFAFSPEDEGVKYWNFDGTGEISVRQ